MSSNEREDHAREDHADEGYVLFNALWSGVINDFDREERHAKFLEHVRRTQRYREAAERYASLKDDNERGERAKKRMNAVAVLAMETLLVPSRGDSTARRTPGWVIAMAVAVSVALIGWALFLATRGVAR